MNIKEIVENEHKRCSAKAHLHNDLVSADPLTLLVVMSYLEARLPTHSTTAIGIGSVSILYLNH